MENDSIFDQIINNPSAVLWNMILPLNYDEYIEIAQAFKYLEGYPETFFTWSKNLTNFEISKEEWEKLPLKLSKNMEKKFCFAEKLEKETSKVINLPIELPLDVKFADELSESFEAPDEIVEGLFTAGDGSILYGDSNSGKTYFVIDIACSLARGVDWFGRKTEKGIVIYLAVESPSSVERRLQSYQHYHNVRVPNFCIVRNPINLFDGEEDTNKIIQLIKIIERQRGEKVRLVIGDTLARLSAGANENAGTDMGIVVKHFDYIRKECNTHFLLIHHSGKNAANGARGWSGVRAAVETEIEVTDNGEIKCAEITKQRDLSTKGLRIGFKTFPITIGKNKWGDEAISCVVLPSEAPSKFSSKRTSEIGGAILEYVTNSKTLLTKKDLKDHFVNRYPSSSIYRELKKLSELGKVNIIDGLINI